jgi:hypothetical protein
MADIISRYTFMDSVGSGTAMDPKHPADWYGQRIDLFCRAIRRQLFCLNPDGTPNDSVQADVRDFVRVHPVQYVSAGFVIIRFDIPHVMLDLILQNARHPDEDGRDDQYVSDSIEDFIQRCVLHNIIIRNALNNLNLGWTLGTDTPLADILTAMNSFSAASLGAATHRAMRLRYFNRLRETNTDGFPAFLGGETINAPACVSYANSLDALPKSHPANLIHILYELAGTTAAVAAVI